MQPSTTSNNERDRLSLNLNVCELSGVRDVACGSRFWIVSTRSFGAETALPGENSSQARPDTSVVTQFSQEVAQNDRNEPVCDVCKLFGVSGIG